MRGAIVCLEDKAGGEPLRGLTSKLLLPVAGDLAALGLDGLLAVGSRARPFPGAEAAVAFVGHADAPLPVPAGGDSGLLSWRSQAQISRLQLWLHSRSCRCLLNYTPPPHPPTSVGLFKAADVMGLHRGADFQFKLTPFLN